MTVSRASFTHRGLTLSYRDSAPGDDQRPVVLLLHGFPDSSAMWSAQIDALHADGFRCIAPDTVGCGDSDMAPKLGDYNIVAIAGDHVALLDHLGIEQAHVVGHDWGGWAAWLIAGRYPSRVRRLAVLSVGHPTAYSRAGIAQKLAAWYIGFFLLGGVTEYVLGSRGPLGLARMLSGSHPDPDEVVARLSMPGRLTAGLRIYRASMGTVLFRRQPTVTVPTLGIWSRGDPYLVAAQMRDSRQYVDVEWQCETIDGGHWIPLEHPNWLGARLRRFLNG